MGNVTAKTSGDIASFMTPVETNITSLKVHFSPKQLGEGDPSPENVREIVGWDGVEVNGCGKNIAHIVGYSATVPASSDPPLRKLSNNYGTTISTTNFSLPDTKIIVTQSSYTTEYDPVSYRNGYFAVIVDNLDFTKRYTVSFNVDDIVSNPLNVDLSRIRAISPAGTGFEPPAKIDGNRLFFKNVPFTPHSNYPNRKSFEIRNAGMSFTLSEFMVTPVDDEDFEYEPYRGTIDTTNWSSDVGTVYGGYIDLISGELVEEYTNILLNADTSCGEFRVQSNGKYTVWANVTGMKPSSLVSDEKALCDKAIKTASYQDNKALRILLGYNNNSIYLYNMDAIYNLTTIEQISTWLEENPIHVTVPLAIPIIHQLTPTQLSSFIGQNNFWSNADYVEIEYELKETEDIQKARKKIILNQPHIESVKDDLVNFTTNMKAPLKECKVYFEPVQEGEGDPSPDNVRNITGWNETNIYLSNEITLFNSFGATSGRASGINNNKRVTTNSYGTTINRTDTDGIKTELVITQSIADSTKERYQNGYVSLFPNTDKLIIGSSYYFDADIEIVSNPLDKLPEMMLTDDANNRWTITINDGKLHEAFTWKERPTVYQYPFIEFYCNGCSFKLKNMVITPTREIKTVNWSDSVGTVYGGYVDLVKGELVATHVIFEKKWSEYPNNHAMTDVNRRSILFPYERRKIGAVKALCNIAPPAHDLQNKIHFYIAPENNYIYMFLPKDLDEETLIQVASKIEEPIHYSLTPQQLLTFKGENNIWSDTNGQTEVKFWTH